MLPSSPQLKGKIQLKLNPDLIELAIKSNP